MQDENSHSIPEHINLQAQPLVGQILPYLHSAVSMHSSEYCPAVAPSSAEGFRLWIAEAGLIQTKWTATSRGRAWWEDNKPILSSPPPPPFFSSFLSFFPFFSFSFLFFPPFFFCKPSNKNPGALLAYVTYTAAKKAVALLLSQQD